MKENNHSINRGFGKIFVIISFFCLFLIGFSSAKTIEISTCSDFQNIQNDLTADYVLTNDINCSSGFSPIAGTFVGNLDGRGHTIDFGGLVINNSIFVKVGNITIFNLSVQDLNVQIFRKTDSNLYCNYGGLIGYSNSSLILRNVFFNGNVNFTLAPFSHCSFGSVGGLIGRLDGKVFVLDNIHFFGDVNIIQNHSSSGQISYIGGIVGKVGNRYPLVNFTNSQFLGNISFDNDNFPVPDNSFGSLIGEIGDSSIVIGLLQVTSLVYINNISIRSNINLFDSNKVFINSTVYLGELVGVVCDRIYSVKINDVHFCGEVENSNGFVGKSQMLNYVTTDKDGNNPVYTLLSPMINISNSSYDCSVSFEKDGFSEDTSGQNLSVSSYIENLSDIFWSDVSSGDKISFVSNSTFVNLTIEGNFSIGESFNYSIYLDKSLLQNVLTFSGDEEVYSGSHIITSDEVSLGLSSISWIALFNGSGESAKYYFKIFGNNLEKVSDILEVSKDTVINPTKTEIFSPIDREIYLKNEIIQLSFNVTEQHAPIKEIKYIVYNSGSINSQGNEFSLSGEQDSLLNASVNVSFSSSGQKGITLYTTDSLGNVWKSEVSILVLQEGINVFSKIKSPEDNSNNYNSKIQFNGLSSYILNSTGDSVICVAGDCPSKLNGASSVSISSSITNEEKNLATSDIIFNWSLESLSKNIIGTGLDANVSVFEKIESLGLEKEVSLLLTYLNVSSLASNDYNVISSGTYCLNGKWMNGVSPVSISYDGTVDSCRLSSGDTCCPAGQICNSTNGCEITSRTSCFEYNLSKEDCEYNSNFYSANKSVSNSVGISCGEIIYLNGSKMESVENCKCIWDEEDNTCGVSYDLKSVNFEEDLNSVFSIGTCSIFVKNIVDSCSDTGFISRTYVGDWTWDVSNIEEIDPSNQHNNCTIITKSIVCPAEIELPFFGIIGFILAIGIIFAVYYLFSKKKSKHAKKRI